jgi:hypothetical protein
VINDAWHSGDLELPLDQSFGLGYLVIQYADDTLIYCACLPCLASETKILLQLFSASTGLYINYIKSYMVPINISPGICFELAATFGCKPKSLPSTYLGLPMGTTRPKMEDLVSIIQRIDRRLVGIADTLSYDGRLIVVKSVISAISNFAMCILKLPLGFLDHVEGSSRFFLERQRDQTEREVSCQVGKCMQAKKGWWTWGP